jgi:hypothetical protein
VAKQPKVLLTHKPFFEQGAAHSKSLQFAKATHGKIECRQHKVTHLEVAHI